MAAMSILLGKALKTAREHRGLTQAELAKHLKVSRPAVGQWESGVNEPSTENLIQACSILRLDVTAATGGMVRYINDLPGFDEPVSIIEDRRPEFRHVEDEVVRALDGIAAARKEQDVPVYGVAAAGADADFYTNGEIIDFVRRPPGAARTKDVYALYVVGTSMLPRFEEGDLVYVNPGRPAAIGDYVIIEMHPEKGERAGRGYVKRLTKKTAEKVFCEQFNPAKTIEFQSVRVKSLHRIMPWKEVLGI